MSPTLVSINSPLLNNKSVGILLIEYFMANNYTYLLQDKNGQILDAHSISAGLDITLKKENLYFLNTLYFSYYSFIISIS